jgi:hypothetical protein
MIIMITSQTISGQMRDTKDEYNLLKRRYPEKAPATHQDYVVIVIRELQQMEAEGKLTFKEVR